jgi:hypothetical protein
VSDAASSVTLSNRLIGGRVVGIVIGTFRVNDGGAVRGFVVAGGLAFAGGGRSGSRAGLTSTYVGTSSGGGGASFVFSVAATVPAIINRWATTLIAVVAGLRFLLLLDSSRVLNMDTPVLQASRLL